MIARDVPTLLHYEIHCNFNNLGQLRQLVRVMLIQADVKVVLPANRDRIAPVLDAARSFVVMESRSDGTLPRQEVLIADANPVAKARRIVELGGSVLICGAISWPLEAMLTSSGMRVVPNTCGPLDEVVAAFFAGELTERAFLMPGCPGRQHRHRRRRGRRRRHGW